VPDERKPIISGNWKMHLNHFEAIQLVQKLSYALTKEDYDAVDVTVHPPFTDIRSVQTVLDADRIPIVLGAQHCHWEEKGAFTGEVSPAMLAKLNVHYVVAGHSERRELFGETDEWVNKKVKAIIAHEMTPIMCVGETHGADAAAAVRVQYGGSVKATNAAELMAGPDVDGCLVGGASLDPDDFARIVRYRAS